MRTSINDISNFISKNITKYDLEVKSKESVGGKALFRASIDKVEGGNYCTGGWEYDLEEAFDELLKELEKVEKDV